MLIDPTSGSKYILPSPSLGLYWRDPWCTRDSHSETVTDVDLLFVLPGPIVDTRLSCYCCCSIMLRGTPWTLKPCEMETVDEHNNVASCRSGNIK